MGKMRAGIDIDALTSELDELCAEVTPSKVMLRVYELERGHQQRVVMDYQRFVAQTEAYLDLLVRAVHHTNYVAKSGWPPHKTAQILLVVHNVKPLLSGFDRLMKGYYEDGLALFRISYEALLRILFISLNPDDPYYSFAPRTKGLKQFNLSNFVAQELKLNWSHYRVMSSMAHANQFKAMGQLIELHKEGQTDPIAVAFRFDESMLSLGMNHLHILVLLYLRTVLTLFIAHGQNDADVDVANQCRRYIALYQKALACHVNPHLRPVAKDIDDIFEMLAKVEAGHDWKIVWERLRGS